MKPKTWASDIMDRAVAFVGKTGPSTSLDIAAAIGVTQALLIRAIYTRSDLIVVGAAPRHSKNGVARNLYGLADPNRDQWVSTTPTPAAPKASSFACARLGRTVELMECVEAYTEATARYRSTPCAQCRTGKIHRERFAGFAVNDGVAA